MAGSFLIENQKVVKVLLAIPNEGHAPVEAYANRLVNFLHLGRMEERSKTEETRFEFYFITMGRIFTPLAREEAAKHALAAEMDYILFIDDDMMCPDDLFEKLYRHNVDIVAPLAFTRNYPHRAVLYSIKEGWDASSRQDYFINHWIDNYPKDKLVECDAVGFGAALINMRVIRTMPKPYFMSTSGTGEDIFFCHRAKKCGFRVFMDTGTKLGHLSHPVQITEDYVERIHKLTNYQIRENAKEYDKYEPLVLIGDKYS